MAEKKTSRSKQAIKNSEEKEDENMEKKEEIEKNIEETIKNLDSDGIKMVDGKVITLKEDESFKPQKTSDPSADAKHNNAVWQKAPGARKYF